MLFALEIIQKFKSKNIYSKIQKKNKLISKCGCHVDVMRSATIFGFDNHSILGRTMNVFSRWPLQGVTLLSLISWELSSMKFYKTLSFQFIAFSKRSLSIFIWKDKACLLIWKYCLKMNKQEHCEFNYLQIKKWKWQSNQNIM